MPDDRSCVCRAKSLLIVAFLFYICYILPMRQKAVTIYYSGESLSESEMSAEGVQQEYTQNIPANLSGKRTGRNQTIHRRRTYKRETNLLWTCL